MIEEKPAVQNNMNLVRNLLILQARLWACGRGEVSTPSFGCQLNPISTRGGADYAHPILVFTQSFESHRRACT